MRISQNQIYDGQRRSIQKTFAEMAKWQDAMSTGRKINTVSDDPLNTGILLKSRSVKSAITQYDGNLRVAKDYLGNSENRLSDIGDVLNQAYQLAVQGGTSTVDQKAKEALATQVDQLQARLLTLANSQGSDNQYLFAGQATDKPPYSIASNALLYAGDANPIRIETGPLQTLNVNTPGGKTFQDAFSRLEKLKVNLRTANTSAISGIDIADIQKSLGEFRQLRSEAGTAMRTVDGLQSVNRRRMDELTEGISNIEEVDYAEAATRLKQSETAYQAALQVTANASRLSLLDYLR
jgi:flagellar hook-associated protein 3 FlgL